MIKLEACRAPMASWKLASQFWKLRQVMGKVTEILCAWMLSFLVNYSWIVNGWRVVFSYMWIDSTSKILLNSVLRPHHGPEEDFMNSPADEVLSVCYGHQWIIRCCWNWWWYPLTSTPTTGVYQGMRPLQNASVSTASNDVKVTFELFMKPIGSTYSHGRGGVS